MEKSEPARIRCSRCGNDGADGGAWELHWHAPFKLIEKVISYWEFAVVERNGATILEVDARSERIDPESGEELRIECNSCFDVFPVPEGIDVSFE